MSIIGSLLNNKMSNPEIKRNFYYSDYVHSRVFDKCDKYTYFDLYNKVEYFKNHIMNNYMARHVCFLVIDNSIDDIAYFIALMEVGMKPIIIHKDKLIEFYLANNDLEYMETNPNIGNIHMPYDRGHDGHNVPNYSKEVDYISNIDIRSTCYLSNIKNEIKLDRLMINRILNYYIRKNDLLSSLNESDYDFGILTSGTTNNFKIQKVKEKDLYEKVLANYDLETKEKIVNTTPISSISGLLFNLYIPLLSNNKEVCVSQDHLSPLEHEEGLMSVVLPGGKNLFEDYGYFYAERVKKILSHLQLNHVYFMGKKLTLENVENIRKYIEDLPDDCIFNFYGNTENLGLICKCSQKNLKPIYVYGLCITNDAIIFSPDKKNVYKKTMVDGKPVISKMDLEFDNELYIPILPISDNYLRESKIINLDDNAFGELFVNDEKTNDFGFEYNNLLYLVGRNNEFIQKDNRFIFLSSFENAIREKIGLDCSIAKNDSMTNIYIIAHIHDITDQKQYAYRREFEKIKEVKDFVEKHKIPIDNYVILDGKDLPTGVEIGKIKKDFLLQYSFPKLDIDKIGQGYDELLSDVVSKQISTLLGKIVKVNIYNDKYVFDKKTFNFIDILNIFSNYNINGFLETDDSYVLGISDSFMLAKHPNNIPPKVNLYNSFRELFSNEEEKISIKVTFDANIKNGICFKISKCDLLEPLEVDYNYDVRILDYFSRQDISNSNNIIRYMLGPIETDENNQKYTYNFHDLFCELNVPFYFTAYMKNGKIYLEENFNVQYEEKETNNKIYKIKK